MRKPIFLIIPILLFSCTAKEEKINPTVASIVESIYASGIVKSKNQYQVFARVNGIIEQVFVAEGDFVKKGAPILTVYNETQRLNKESSILSAQFNDFSANQGKLTDAMATIELAKHKLTIDSALFLRQSALWQQQIGTKVDLEQRELNYQNAKNTLASAIIKYKDLKRQLDYASEQSKKNLTITGKIENEYTVRSEMDGMVYSLTKLKGEMINTQTPLGVIGDTKQFVLEMQVDEYDILKIKKGLPVLVSLDSHKGVVYNALVTKINPLMNERSKTFLVEAEFVLPPETLYPNISFEANIVIQKKEKVILIPRNYLVNDSMVLKGNGDTTHVKTGLKDYQKIEILSGITATDELKKPAK